MDNKDLMNVKMLVESYGEQAVLDGNILNEAFSEGKESILNSLFLINELRHTNMEGKVENPLSPQGVKFLRSLPLLLDKIKNDDIKVYVDANMTPYLADFQSGSLEGKSDKRGYKKANAGSLYGSDLFKRRDDFQTASSEIKKWAKKHRVDFNGDEDFNRFEYDGIFNTLVPQTFAKIVRKRQSRVEGQRGGSSMNLEDVLDDATYAKMLEYSDKAASPIDTKYLDLAQEAYKILRGDDAVGVTYQMDTRTDDTTDGYKNLSHLGRVSTSEFIAALVDKGVFDKEDSERVLANYRREMENFKKDATYVDYNIFKKAYSVTSDIEFTTETKEGILAVYKELRTKRRSYNAASGVYSVIFKNAKKYGADDNGTSRVRNYALDIVNSVVKKRKTDIDDEYALTILTDRKLKILYVVYCLDFGKNRFAYIPSRVFYGWAEGYTPDIITTIALDKVKKADAKVYFEQKQYEYVSVSGGTAYRVRIPLKDYEQFKEDFFSDKGEFAKHVLGENTRLEYNSRGIDSDSIIEDDRVAVSFNILPTKITATNKERQSAVEFKELYTVETEEKTVGGEEKHVATITTENPDVISAELDRRKIAHSEDGGKVVIVLSKDSDYDKFYQFIEDTEKIAISDKRLIRDSLDELRDITSRIFALGKEIVETNKRATAKNLASDEKEQARRERNAAIKERDALADKYEGYGNMIASLLAKNELPIEFADLEDIWDGSIDAHVMGKNIIRTDRENNLQYQANNQQPTTSYNTTEKEERIASARSFVEEIVKKSLNAGKGEAGIIDGKKFAEVFGKDKFNDLKNGIASLARRYARCLSRTDETDTDAIENLAAKYDTFASDCEWELDKIIGNNSSVEDVANLENMIKYFEKALDEYEAELDRKEKALR